MKKDIPLETGEKKAGILGCKYFKVSAKTGQNIPEIFHELQSSLTERVPWASVMAKMGLAQE